MAVVNVAGLLLVRAATRVREFSMRFALGATNSQVLRQHRQAAVGPDDAGFGFPAMHLASGVPLHSNGNA